MFKNAACLGEPTNWWFPERDGKSNKELSEIWLNTRKATAICKTCPCLRECLQYSLENYEVGIWGGMGEKLRKEARRMFARGVPISHISEKLLGVDWD